MKKIVSTLLLFALVFSFIPKEIKAEEKQVISYEEYANALVEKFAEYGRVLEVQPQNEEFVYTKDLLDEELRKAEIYLATPITFSVVEKNISKDKSIMHPKSMIGTESFYDEVAVIFGNAPMPEAVATVGVTATLTLDYQTDCIVSGGSPSCVIMGGVAIDDYFELLSYKTRISNASATSKNRNIMYTIKGRFKLDYSAVGVTAWQKVDKEFIVGFNPF
ncbi:MAG: hypothetical protein KH452_10100 [Clostridiales bacterium]|nr:hypothetical protein [Clostridiales bacterium]